jgi:Protein of unknown function (DUF2771)
VTSVRKLALLAIVAVLAVGAGIGAWALAHEPGSLHPEISAYSDGHSTRVGPYRYCSVLDLTDCQNAGSEGELRVNSHAPVQLSVPTSIGQAPWWLLTVYEDSAIPTTTFYRSGSRLAVTIPTVDPHHGRLIGIAVQLMTVFVDPSGEVQGIPHAEWSVRTVWR